MESEAKARSPGRRRRERIAQWRRGIDPKPRRQYAQRIRHAVKPYVGAVVAGGSNGESVTAAPARLIRLAERSHFGALESQNDGMVRPAYPTRWRWAH